MSADFDLFFLFRSALAWLVGIYASVITLQSIWGWYLWLAGSDKFTSMLRRYLLVHGLRLRFRTFWGDVIICVLLTVAFFILWHAQGVLDATDRAVADAQATEERTAALAARARKG